MSIALPTYPYSSKNFFKNLSQIFAVITAFVLPLSTAALMSFFLATVFCTVLAGDWQEKYLILRSNPLAWMFILFFGLFLIGLSYTAVPLPDALHTLRKYSKFLLGFFLFSTFRHQKTAIYAFAAFLFSASITLLLSLLKFFADWDLLHRFISDSGVFKDHIFTGFLLAFSSYCYALFAFSVKKGWRWFFILLFLVTVYDVLFINLARSGYVVLLSLILLLAWQQFSWRGLFTAIVVSILLLSGLSFLPANFKDRLNLVHREIHQYHHGKFDTSVGLRLEFYKNSLKLLAKHPWIGTGTGSFSRDYFNVVADKQFVTQNPHNEYLNIAVQFGLVGVVILSAMFLVHWRQSFRLIGIHQCFAQAVLTTIVIGSVFNSWLMDVSQGCFYVFFSALLLANLPPSSQPLCNIH